MLSLHLPPPLSVSLLFWPADTYLHVDRLSLMWTGLIFKPNPPSMTPLTQSSLFILKSKQHKIYSVYALVIGEQWLCTRSSSTFWSPWKPHTSTEQCVHITGIMCDRALNSIKFKMLVGFLANAYISCQVWWFSAYWPYMHVCVCVHWEWT